MQPDPTDKRLDTVSIKISVPGVRARVRMFQTRRRWLFCGPRRWAVMGPSQFAIKFFDDYSEAFEYLIRRAKSAADGDATLNGS